MPVEYRKSCLQRLTAVLKAFNNNLLHKLSEVLNVIKKGHFQFGGRRYM